MNIKEAREIAGYTMKQVEEKFGIPTRSLQNWENGYRKPTKFVEESLIEKLLQVKNTARIRLKPDRILFETLSPDGAWELYASFLIAEVPERGSMVPVDLMETIQRFYEKNYKILWVKE